MISHSTIEKIIEASRIEEVIGEFLSLRKRGVNYIGLCPFHDEKTPSFTVSPTKGIYKCFGCGEAGNSVKFLMEHEHYTYPEALKYLAQKYNIEVEETFTDTKEDKAEQERKDSLYIVNAFAQRYFTELLFDNEEGQSIGHSYFKERGFRDETMRKFQLGYSLEEEDAFAKAASEKGYQTELLERAGLIKQKGARKSDFFSGRVLFTIHNLSGKVVGFGGRTLKSDKKIPKYINTPESDIYHKSKILYGIYFAKNSIRKEDECLLVEGYTDVVSLSQGGIENVVASSGTSLTTEQVRLVKRLTQNITILFDGDAAGLKAALRGIDIILEADMNVKIVVLPEGEDPDSFIKTVGSTELKQYVKEKSRDFILFKTETLVEECKDDPVKKSEAIRDIVSSIALVPDAIKRALFIKECSKLLEVDEQILVTETNKIKRKNFSRATNTDKGQAELISPDPDISHEQRQVDYGESFSLQEQDIIRLLLEYSDQEVQDGVSVLEVILNELKDIEFENDILNTIRNEYYSGYENHHIPNQKHFLNHSNEKISALAIEILHSPYEISDNWDKMHDIMITEKRFLFKKDIKSSICRFKLKKVNRMIGEYQKKAKTIGDEAEIKNLLLKIANLTDVKKELAAQIGTVVIQ